MNLDKQINIYLSTLDLNNKNILLGYSAGADSTALLHILKNKEQKFNFKLSAVFFSHANSPMNLGEDESLKLAQETCKNLNVPFFHKEIYMEKESRKSWEEIGRNHRREFYQTSNSDYVFLGHHEDDQNETTMIQLFRGAGKGISGMKKFDGFYCRPLLDVYKDDVYNYLKYHNIKWIEDPTNVNTDFTRNFWRKQVLPLIETHYPEYKKALALFRKKQSTNNFLLKELAIVDGLNDLIEGKSIYIDHLNNERLTNLIQHLGQSLKSNLENTKIENFLKQKNANLYLPTNNFILQIEKIDNKYILNNNLLSIKKHNKIY